MRVLCTAAEVHQPKPTVARIAGDISRRHVAVLDTAFVQQLNLCEQVAPEEQSNKFRVSPLIPHKLKTSISCF
jgi:hypothetical protein